MRRAGPRSTCAPCIHPRGRRTGSAPKRARNWKRTGLPRRPWCRCNVASRAHFARRATRPCAASSAHRVQVPDVLQRLPATLRVVQSDMTVAAETLIGTQWRRIAYTTLVSRALDDVEEATNKNKASVPREHLVLYQFSARGHEMSQVILGSMLDHPHDGAGAYYRSRPFLLSLGLSIEDALASPLGRVGGFSGGRDIGV